VLHRFSAFLAASTVLLIVAGGLVTSTGSGLAVPDWPTTYGWSMFTFPLDKMVGGILYEHGHRLIATSVGILTIVLTVWLWFGESRRWLRRVGVAALVAVCAQGLLGGLTVLFFLPAPVSIAHAGLAQLFFCLTVSITLFTSRSWRTIDGHRPIDDTRLRLVASASTIAIYLQILLGATMRHTAAGLAIPDFPLVFGGILPPHWTMGIAVHYAHRLGAVLVAALIVRTAGHVWLHHWSIGQLRRPALLAVALAVVQISLGGLTVLSRRGVAVNTAHVAVGALLLATSLVITLRSWHARFARSAADGRPAELTQTADFSRGRSSAGARA
jgi:cytochrome c oxidase assembly protein subunit 15